MDIGQTIKMFRTAFKIKQKDFAKRLNISANYLYLVENGKRNPSLPFLKSASREFNIPITFFFIDELDESKLGPVAKEVKEKLKAIVFDLQRLRQEYKDVKK